MKLVTYQAAGGPSTGVLCGETTVDLPVASQGELPGRMVALLGCEDSMGRVGRLLLQAKDQPGSLPPECFVPLEGARLLAPVLRPGKVSCLGLNYSEHAAEGGARPPAEPIIFGKASSSVIGPGAPIVVPAASEKVDYEVELGVVIGRRAKLVSATAALDYVAGYTVLNDVSGRDYQHEKPGKQWYLGKSFDTFCPLGPWLVTADEIPDPQRLSLECKVNGEVMQSSSTAHMVFSVAVIIEYLSRVFTLEVGDVIGTGTPAGVGESRTPPRFLRPGDVVQCAVGGVGTLENPVT